MNNNNLFLNVIYNKQFSIDNELSGYSVTTADHVKSTWPFPGNNFRKNNGDVVIADYHGKHAGHSHDIWVLHVHENDQIQFMFVSFIITKK